LRWIFEGWKAYGDHGLNPPPAVAAKTKDYRAESDAIARFLESKMRKVGNAFSIKASVLWSAYKDWAAATNERPGSEKDFAKAMRSHGYESIKRRDGYMYEGLLMYEVDIEPSEPEDGDIDRDWYR